MDFIKIPLVIIFEKKSFWSSIDLQFKLVYNLAYLLDFDLRMRSGQVWDTMGPKKWSRIRGPFISFSSVFLLLGFFVS